MAKLENDTLRNRSLTFGSLGVVYNYGIGDLVDESTYTVKLLISIVLSIFMVMSIIGNVCTCAVIVRDRNMRTPTNCYLANLAITDLMISLFIPIEVYVIWMPGFYPIGGLGCRIHFILLGMFSNCNLFIITAFTIERYIVVTRPFTRQKLMTNSRVFKIVGVIWILSLCFCIPDIFYVDLLEDKKAVLCLYTISRIPSIVIGFEIVMFFIVPMTIIVVVYILIAQKLHSDNKKLRSSPVNGRQHRDKAVKMLVVIATSFFIFWSPYCVLRVMVIHPEFNYENYLTTWKITNYLCYNSYIASAVNPVLYSLMSRKFRQALKVFLKGRPRTPRSGTIRTINQQSIM